MKLIITCGGTGGHFYPGLTIAQTAKKQGIDVKISLSGKHTQKFADTCKKSQIPCSVQTAFSRPTAKWKLPILGLKVLQDVIKCYRFLGKEKPDAVLGMGSFASFGICFAAKLRRIPLYLHEGNSVAGASNCFLSKSAKTLFLSFNAINKSAVKCETVLTGFPVRSNFVNDSKESFDRNEICKKMGCNPNKKIILFFGGSQGAKTLNTRIANAFNSLSDSNEYQVLHLAGNAEEVERLKALYDNKVDVILKGYIENMSDCYRIADLAIARGGAASLFELALFSIPTIVIPLPWAADNHQFENAKSINDSSGKQAVEICNQTEVEEKLPDLVTKFMKDPKTADDFHNTLDGSKSAGLIISQVG